MQFLIHLHQDNQVIIDCRDIGPVTIQLSTQASWPRSLRRPSASATRFCRQMSSAGAKRIATSHTLRCRISSASRTNCTSRESSMNITSAWRTSPRWPSTTLSRPKSLPCCSANRVNDTASTSRPSICNATVRWACPATRNSANIAACLPSIHGKTCWAPWATIRFSATPLSFALLTISIFGRAACRSELYRAAFLAPRLPASLPHNSTASE